MIIEDVTNNDFKEISKYLNLARRSPSKTKIQKNNSPRKYNIDKNIS